MAIRRLREATFQPFVQIKEAGRKPTYPSNHKPVLRVPKGGSMCANCEYLGNDKKTCKQKDYIKFMGTNKLPYPADQMCSDWWEPK